MGLVYDVCCIMCEYGGCVVCRQFVCCCVLCFEIGEYCMCCVGCEYVNF